MSNDRFCGNETTRTLELHPRTEFESTTGGKNVIVLMVSNGEMREWLDESAQAVLDRVSEIADEPQDALIAGLAEVLRQRLGLLAVIRAPQAKGVQVVSPGVWA